MREDQHRFLLLLPRVPARLTVEQTAWVLNCQPHDVPVLVAARLLKPLGNPPLNGVKFFCASEILGLAQDRTWFGKMSNALYQHWRTKNGRRRNAARRPAEGEGSPAPPLQSGELPLFHSRRAVFRPETKG